MLDADKTITNIDIGHYLNQLDDLLNDYESEVVLEKRINLLEKAKILSFSINQYFNDPKQAFNLVNEIKLTAVGVLNSQVSFWDPKA